MSLKLYHDAMSQPCRALYMFFRSAGIPYQDVWVALRKNEHLKPEFTAINPFQKVPVLVDEAADGGKIVIRESCSIARYAASKYLAPSSHWWPMDDERKSTRIDEYLHWQHLNLRTNGSLVFINAILNPFRRNEPPNIKQVHRFSKRLDQSADLLQSHFLDKGKFIAGDEISVADLFAVAEVMQPWSAGFDISTTRPRIATWIDDVKSETQPHYDAAHVYNKQIRETAGVGIQKALKAFLEENQEAKSAANQ